ncbi:MAG: translation initiation factor IF-2 associated domain-containing protein, partial [Methylococcaceae bacterium]
MSDVTVRQLAGVVGIPPEKLLTQLADAGLNKTGSDDTLSDSEKRHFLGYLRQSHGKQQKDAAEPSRVTLQRRTVSELKQGKVPGKATKTISVEVRKTRTYIKRNETPEPVESTAIVDKPLAPAREPEPQLAPVQDDDAIRLKAQEEERVRQEQQELAEKKRQEEEATAALAEQLRLEEEKKQAELLKQREAAKRQPEKKPADTAKAPAPPARTPRPERPPERPSAAPAKPRQATPEPQKKPAEPPKKPKPAAPKPIVEREEFAGVRAA